MGYGVPGVAVGVVVPFAGLGHGMFTIWPMARLSGSGIVSLLSRMMSSSGTLKALAMPDSVSPACTVYG